MEIPYPELRRLIDDKGVQTSEANGASGGSYYLEIQTLWDTVPSGNIRVIAAIDDDGIRAYRPLTRDFIKTPDGSLLDEVQR
jgi:hypothetical protein